MIGTPPVTRHIPGIHYTFSLRTKASHLWLAFFATTSVSSVLSLSPSTLVWS
ncbi:unnamed product [Ostreococcus tauri]|uniref:Unnamed product n=1 Tax=Ostreococcus tauri TaxID=70448 RepID=A0A096PAF4_OSTTA|nr:unnamed product [Ostreococcus tauri]CEG01899.1 unnamed product [Ostreococcus tauri]|eukprot:XP_022841235.1 unnamed product [Ostreococcus tauri]